MKLEVLTKTDNQNIQKNIISKIGDLINHKNLEPGDKLPSERMLSEKFGVTRSNVREAIQKLEFYGLLKSIPQSGTFVANIGVIAMNGMIEDILRLEDPDFKSLVETRILLELKTVRLAALRRTDDDLDEMKATLDAYTKKVLEGEDAVEEDLLFHLKIAEASKNSVLNSLMLIITPDIMQYFKTHNVCGDGRSDVAVKQHEIILEHIKNQDPQKVGDSIREHLSDISEYVKTLKTELPMSGNGTTLI